MLVLGETYLIKIEGIFIFLIKIPSIFILIEIEFFPEYKIKNNINY